MRTNRRIPALFTAPALALLSAALVTAPLAVAAEGPGLRPDAPGPAVNVDVEVASPVNFVAEQAATDVEEFWAQRGGFRAPRGYAALPAAVPGDVCLSQLSIARFCSGEIAWDVPDLEQMDAGGGALAVATVIAHEIGHQIQASVDLPASELGADCLAGVYLTSVAEGQSPRLSGTPAEVDDAILSTMYTTRADAIGARLAAFQAGRGGSAEKCLTTFTD
ncbi:MAG: hypothetical protein ACOYBX_04750 [Mycobacterium sp.]